MLAAVLVNLYDAYRLLAIPQGGAGLDSGQRASAALSAVDTFDAGFLLALVFFGVHQVVLGLLLCRSGYVPRAVGVLLVVAGVGYVVDSLASLLVAGHGGLVFAILVTPAVVDELPPGQPQRRKIGPPGGAGRSGSVGTVRSAEAVPGCTQYGRPRAPSPAARPICPIGHMVVVQPSGLARH